LTTDSFTVVFPSGPLTKAQRLAEIKLGKPTENPPLQNERFQRVGNDFIHRYQIDYASFLEVWTKERGNWRVATVQATLLDPDSAAVQQAITAANARFVDNGKYLTVWGRQADGSWKIIRDINNSDRPGAM